MDRINTATKVVDLFGAGKHGFRDGNLTLGIEPTDLEALFFNDFQEEFVAGLIEYAGLVPAAGVRNQVRQAIEILIARATGNDYKASVRVATVGANITLAGGAPNALDGVALEPNNRILVKDQTTGSQNGLYYVSTLGTGANGTWTRSTDADQAGELTSGSIVAVEEGATNADTLWMQTTDGTIAIGTTALVFALKTGLSKQIQSIPTPTLSANAMTLPAATFTLDFRSATLGVGNATTVSGTAAALTIPAGATLGSTSGVQSSIVEVMMNNGGVLERAVVNLAGGNDLSETGVISTTAISAAATAANVFYSNTARTNLPYRVVARYDSTQATAGQWATAPSLVQGAGGNALNAMSSLGYGQVPQDVTAGRSLGTTYYAGPKPKTVKLYVTGAAAGVSYITMTITLGGVSTAVIMAAGGNASFATNDADSILIPAGAAYVATATNCLVNKWYE